MQLTKLNKIGEQFQRGFYLYKKKCKLTEPSRILTYFSCETPMCKHDSTVTQISGGILAQ